MFKTLFAKEIKEILQSNRFTVSFAVCSVLIIMSFVMGAQNYKSSKAQYDAAMQANRNQIAANTDWFGIQHTIMLPPQPLMALVSGLSNDVGRDIEMRGRGELRPDNTRYNDEPIFAIFRFMDLEFIFGVILSLFAIIFAYDAVNGEKTKGTLKLCFANSLPRSKFIAAKLAGSFLGLTIALLIPILIGMAILPLLGVQLSSQEWIKLSLIILTGLLYFGVFLALAIAVSSVTRHPSSSFLLGLVIWIGVVMIIPRSSIILSGRLVDVPNIDEITSEQSKYRAQLWEEDRPKLGSFRASSPEADPQTVMGEFSKFMSDLSEERQKKIDALDQRLNEEFENKVSEREKLALNISRVSPYTQFALAITNLAGTSLELKKRYKEEAKNYQVEYSNFMQDKTGNSGAGGFRMIISNSDDEEEPEKLDPDEMPAFNFESVDTASAVNLAMLDVALLLMLNLIFYGVAFQAFKKYDLR